jgi:hypothetical protein
VLLLYLKLRRNIIVEEEVKSLREENDKLRYEIYELKKQIQKPMNDRQSEIDNLKSIIKTMSKFI